MFEVLCLFLLPFAVGGVGIWLDDMYIDWRCRRWFKATYGPNAVVVVVEVKDDQG